MKKLAPVALLSACVLFGCNSWLQKISESVNALEEAQIVDNLEPSETYYIGRTASAVVTDEVPMCDLGDDLVQRRLFYLNALGGYVERRSYEVSRSSEQLGNFVERTEEQQEAAYNTTLFKRIQIGLLDDTSIRAYATDGGFIWLTSGAVDECRTEDELAAVVAIQLGHIFLNHPMHVYREVHDGRVAEPVGKRADWFAQEGIVANFGRLAITYAEAVMHDYYETPFNLEADRFALLALLEAGYEPRTLVTVLNSMAQARFEPDAGDWLARQIDLDQHITEAAKFIDEAEMRVAPTWHDKAEFRQQRFDEALGR